MDKKDTNLDMCAFVDNCAVSKKNGSCPFNYFNDKSILEIIDYINNDEGEKAIYLMNHYRQCQNRKKDNYPV